MPQPDPAPTCRICSGPSTPVGAVDGRYSGRTYRLARCPACGYAFVTDPWLDYEAIYDDRYYAGEGADPWIDYRFELEHPDRTVRRYEWRGVEAVVESLMGGRDPNRRWLDYGAGNGGLVRHLRARGAAEAFGFDHGSIVEDARAQGIPMLTEEELAEPADTFDVVTAIEVIEHTFDPLAELRRIRQLLRPGGLLFLTTGNARPYADRLSEWRYVVPEIHISLFEPRTLERALAATGFTPAHPRLGPGFDEIMKFKALKNLRLRRRSRLTDLLPARAIARPADRVARLSEHPVGWAS